MELVNAASAYLNATEGTARDKALCYGVAKDIVSVLAPICRSGPTSCGTRRSAARVTPTPPPGPSSIWPSPLRTRCRSWSRCSVRSAVVSTLPAMPPMRICSCRRGRRRQVARGQGGRQGHLRARQAGQPGGQVSAARIAYMKRRGGDDSVWSRPLFWLCILATTPNYPFLVENLCSR